MDMVYTAQPLVASLSIVVILVIMDMVYTV